MGPNEKEQAEISREQSYFVAKSNTIIRATRYTLTKQELKLSMYLISKIKPFVDDENTEYTISLKRFCEVAKIDYHISKNYQDIKAAIQKLADRSVWIKIEPTREKLFRMLDDVDINTGKGTITYKFHHSMFPYLLELSEQYTTYSLENVLPMNSKYGLALFEVLKSYSSIGFVEYQLDELKKLLNATVYDRYNLFKVNVLDRGLADINTYSDIEVSYTPVKTGRAITSIKFFIKAPSDDEAYKRSMRRRYYLE